MPALAAARGWEPFNAPRVPAGERRVVHHDDARVIPGGGPTKQLAGDEGADPAEPADGDPSSGKRPKKVPRRLSTTERIVEKTAGHAPCRRVRERAGQSVAQSIVSNDEALYVHTPLGTLDARQHFVGEAPHVGDYPHLRRWYIHAVERRGRTM